MLFLQRLYSITEYNIDTYQLVLELDQLHNFPSVDPTITRQTVKELRAAAALISEVMSEYQMRDAI